MKTFYFILIAFILATYITGCSMWTPYGKISTASDSQIFIYTDSDTSVKDGITTTDDTTVIVIGVENGQDIESIFNNAMNRVKDIFSERSKVYRAWMEKD